jgi:hypothetical protein
LSNKRQRKRDIQEKIQGRDRRPKIEREVQKGKSIWEKERQRDESEYGAAKKQRGKYLGRNRECKRSHRGRRRGKDTDWGRRWEMRCWYIGEIEGEGRVEEQSGEGWRGRFKGEETRREKKDTKRETEGKIQRRKGGDSGRNKQEDTEGLRQNEPDRVREADYGRGRITEREWERGRSRQRNRKEETEVEKQTGKQRERDRGKDRERGKSTRRDRWERQEERQ